MMRRIFTFGRFELIPAERLLQREGRTVPLSPKAFDTLLVLVEHAGRLVDRDQLLRSVWKDVHVDEAMVPRVIFDLRRALKQTEQEVWIETVPKFGYRFVGEVKVTGGEAAADPAPALRRRMLGWAAVPAVLVLLAIWAFASLRPEPGPPLQIAVLPFQVVNATGPNEVLAVGIADGLITRLSGIQNLVVRPVSLVRRYAAQPVDARQAGRELAVDAVVEGTLQLAGGKVRANVRLVHARDGEAWWAGTVSSPNGELLSVEDSLVEQVAENLAVRISPAERRALAVRGHSPQAYDLYLKGRYEWGKRTRAGLEAARDYFRQAIDLDPGYARAHSGLADCYLLLGGYGFYPQLEMLPKAKATALRALELNPSLSETRATLGLITQNLDWDWAAVEKEYRQAIALDPNYATAHHWYAEFLSILGRFDESHREFALARRLDPVSPIIQADEAQLYFFEKRYSRAMETLQQLSQIDPDFEPARERMAWIHLVEGRENEAWKELERMPSCGAGSECRKIWTAWLPGRDREAAGAALRELDPGGGGLPRVAPFAVVIAHTRQGNCARALDWLEYMADKHEVWLITAKVNPLFDVLRGDPRFQVVLRNLRFPAA